MRVTPSAGVFCAVAIAASTLYPLTSALSHPIRRPFSSARLFSSLSSPSHRRHILTTHVSSSRSSIVSFARLRGTQPSGSVCVNASRKEYDSFETDVTASTDEGSPYVATEIEHGAKSEQDTAVSSSSGEAAAPSTGARILDLAVPALIGLAIDPLMTIADTAFVGRYSAPNDPYPLAGLGSAAALLIFAFYIFNFLATATAPLVANRRASNDPDGASRVGGQALALALSLGSVLTVALLTFREPLLLAMGTGSTGQEADAYANAFLSVRALAAPAVLTCSASAGIFRGYLDARTPTVILLGSNAVNLALDVVLVANMGMGPEGAAIATTTAEWIAALAFLGVLAGKLPSANGEKSELGSNGARLGKDAIGSGDAYATSPSSAELNADKLTIAPSWELPVWMDVKPLVVASSAVFLRTVVLQIALSLAAAMAARPTAAVGDATELVAGAASSSVAAHQIALQLWLLCSFLCDALASASQALVADGIGRGDADAVREVSRTVFAWGLGLGLFLSAALWAGTGFFVEFFTSDDATRIELAKLLTLVIVAQPLNSFVFAADGVLQGAEEFGYQAKTMALSVFVAFGVFAVLQYLPVGREVAAALQTGEDGGDTLVNVWYGLIALQFMRGFTSLVKLLDKQGPVDLLGKGNIETIAR